MIFVWTARVIMPGFREEIFVSPALINSLGELTEDVYEVGMFAVPHAGHALLFLPTMVIKLDNELTEEVRGDINRGPELPAQYYRTRVHMTTSIFSILQFIRRLPVLLNLIIPRRKS